MSMWTGKKYCWINGCSELLRNNIGSTAYITSTCATRFGHGFTVIPSLGIHWPLQYWQIIENENKTK